LVKTLLSLLKDLGHLQAARKIPFVKDRPGHDWRYAIDGYKSERELGWRPRETIGTGLLRTVGWYLENSDWIPIRSEGEAIEDVLNRWVPGKKV
jgi:dTDP-glucose 4,6-dehydratase